MARSGKQDFSKLAGSKVLVAEDNPMNQTYVLEILGQLGIDPVLAVNGEEALDRFADQRFDLVLMDVQMPVLDGYETTRRLRMLEEAAGLPHCPVVALTANAMKGDREKCLKAGMDDYLSKPVKTETLKETIFYWIIEGEHEDSIMFEPQPSKFETMTADDAPLISEEELKEIRLIVQDRFVEVVGQYIESVTVLLQGVRNGVRKGDIEEITFAAHDIKSSSRQFGALKLSCIAHDLEYTMREVLEDRKSIKDANLPRMIADLEETFAKTISAFSTDYGANRGP